MFDLVICKYKKSMVIHNTECPYWDQVSLNNTCYHVVAEISTIIIVLVYAIDAKPWNAMLTLKVLVATIDAQWEGMGM